MNEHFQVAGRMQIVNALEKCVWDDVPIHRVVDLGGGACMTCVQRNMGSDGGDC